MKRKIITIDEALCNGCGECIPNCPEGALQIIDGKARLVSDLFCDGLGACTGECPTGALKVIEREAEPYDERRVALGIAKQGRNTAIAHLKHLKAHGEEKLFTEAMEVFRAEGLEIAPADLASGCGCPGGMARSFAPKEAAGTAAPSQLRQWPTQLALIHPGAVFFDDADLLVSADCVPFAFGDFHRRLLAGKIVVQFCPKLDADLEKYVEKLAEIFRLHHIRSVTVARMEVPCCGGTVKIVEEALRRAGKTDEIKVKIVALDGGSVQETR